MILHERPDHRDGIRAVLDAAFGGPDESALVARLHSDGMVRLSLVYEIDGKVVGHILFCALSATFDGHTLDAVALAPLAVEPERQRRGIGAALMHEGLHQLPESGADAVFVLGDPAYYRRFGFSSETAAAFRSPFSGEAFMALEIRPGTVSGSPAIDAGPPAGRVTYPAAFAIKE